MSITAILEGAKDLQATLGEDEVMTAEMDSEGFIAKDGGFYTPSVSNVNESTIAFSFAASEERMPAVPDAQVQLRQGPQGERGPKGDKGDRGDRGEAFTYEDFTAEQLAGLKGPKGDTGPQGIQGPNGEKGDTGAGGERGTGILNTTTGIASYTTAVGGVSPKYRILLSTLKTQSKVNDVLVGDTVRYSTYLYPVIYVDSEYAYMTTRVSIKGATGDTGPQGPAGDKGDKGDPGSDATVTTESITNALGYTPADKARLHPTPQDYGAKGDNKTDDTAAFQNALANNRVVFVPGGKYNLSGELVIESNCQLELAQDAVLYFTQTTGNCISMKMSANIVGNHATVSVPYTFSGNVINIDCRLNASREDIPPFTKWDPMWKTARFITDLNIVKPDPRGFYYSVDGTCNGVAVYLRAEVGKGAPNIWATNLSKLRIAGAFKYGIFAESIKSGEVNSNGWIHQMRVDGFIDGSEVGLYLKNIEHAYASVLILPRKAYTTDGLYFPYAKWGICLENCINTNLLGSRVMDWDSDHSLWAEGNMNQHIALLGNCRDVKLDDHHYHGYPSYDIRDMIYAENPSNLDSVSILEEPITRWFKPKDSLPYFNNGDTEKQLLLKEEFNDCFITDYVPNFKDVLPLAIGKDGKIFNEIGYAKYGMRWGVGGSLYTNAVNYGCTGLIPIKAGDTLYLKSMSIGSAVGEAADGNVCVVIFDANFNVVNSNNAKQLSVNESYYNFTYTKTDDGFTLTVRQPATAAYAAFTFQRDDIGDNPAIAVNEPLTYSQVGFLADSITIKPVNVYGLEDFINTEIEQAIVNGDFKSGKGLFYIEGDSTTAGVWTGTHNEISSYYDGLIIAYKTNVAGVSGGTTLNINGLGAVPVYRNASTAVTTNYAAGSVLILTYSGEAWLIADYDANTKNSAGTSNKTGSKMYLVGATSQTSSGTTTYTNTNAYIGTDNCLYSGGKKVYTADDLTDIVDAVKAALPTWTGGSY